MNRDDKFEEYKLSSRRLLRSFFEKNGVRGIKNEESYAINDDSIIFISNEIDRVFVVVSARGAKWGPKVSYFVNKGGDFDNFDYLYVEVPGDLNDSLDDIFDIYNKWIIERLEFS